MAKTVIEAEVKTNVGAVSKDISFMGISVNSVSAAFTKMAVMAKSAFASVKAGIISTGIGALVLAVIALFSYFTKTQRGADMLKKAMAGLGAVVDVLVDLFSSVGEMMVDAFKDPQGAIEDLWEAIKKNLLNRLTGMIDSFKALGEVIDGVFSMDWDKVTEGAKKYGQALVQVTTGLDLAQQQAMLDKAKAIADEIEREAKAAIKLEGIKQGIRREEMKFSKVQAQTRQDVAKARLDAMDETKTQEERLKAIGDVQKKELAMTAGLIELQQKKVNAKIAENALGESMIEDKEALMALEVQLINLKTQSIQTQKRLMTEVETLTLEIAAKEKAAQKVIDDAEKVRIKSEKIDLQALTEWNLTRIEGETDKELQLRMKAAEAADKKLTALRTANELAAEEDLAERALKALEIKYEKDLEELKQYENFLELKKELDIKYTKDKEIIDDKAAEKQRKIEQAVVSAKVDLQKQAFGVLGALAGENVEAGKAIAVAETIFNTQQGIMAAMGATSVADKLLPFPLRLANAIGVGIMGASAVKTILSTSPGSGAGSSPSASVATPAPEMMSGSFELGGGQEVEPLQAYVVSDEITDSQDALALIRRRATI